MKRNFAALVPVALLVLCCARAAEKTEAEWLTDLPKAIAKAKAENKLVFMDFTGSDWCPPCKALHSTVLVSPEFTAYASTNLVLMLVDFPHHKKLPGEQQKANDALMEKYAPEGSVPTIIVLDGNGKQLSKASGYGGESPREFIARLEKIRAKAK